MIERNGDARELVDEDLRPEPMWPEPTDEDIAAAKTAGADVYFLRYGHDVFLVRAPSQGEVRRFADAAADPAKRGFATEQLGRGCILYPEPRLVAEFLRRWPLLGTKLGNDVAGLGRSNEEAVIKKA